MLSIKGRVMLLGLLAVFALGGLFPAAVDARQVTLTSSDLPWTASSGDTVFISGTRISTAGSAIYVPDYVNNTVFEFGTDTLEFGTGGGDQQYGIRFNRADHITINGGTILRRVGPGPNDGQSNRCVYMTSYTNNITFNNTNLVIDGHNGHVVLGYGPMSEIHFNGGTWRSDSQSFTSRHNYDGAVAWLGTPSGNGAYDYWIENVTVANGPAQGIISINCRIIIDNCTVTTDHINIGVPTQNANQYAILLAKAKAGTRITDNRIISGSNRGGSRGIMIENSNGSPSEHILIRGNTLDVHNGPDAESYYGTLRAIRLRSIDGNTVSYVDIFNNTVITTADSDPETTHIGTETIGLDIKMFSSTSSPAHHIRVDSNTVYARALSSNVNAKAAAPIAYGSYVDTSGLSFDYNKLYSCGTIMRLADEGNGISCRDLVMRRNTLGFMDISPTTGNDSLVYANPSTWILGMHPGDQLPIGTGNVSIDAIYVNSASDSDVSFLANPSDADLSQRRTLRVYVRGNNGEPVEGAQVTVRNNYNQTVLSGTTNNGGRVMGTVTYRFEASNSADSTGFNDFYITASKDGDTDTHSNFQVSAYAEGGRDTLDLANTTGTGTWVDDDDDTPSDIDTIAPGPIEDLDASCGPTDNSAVLAWTATGDDGPFGTATRYEIGYSTDPITEGNFAAVDKVASPPDPLPSGFSQSVQVDGLPPSSTYYFGIKVYDEVDNSSELSTSPVFRPFDVTAPVASSETVDEFNRLVTLNAQVTDACVSVHCQFQIDSQESFATAQSAVDETVGSAASATFADLEDDVIYYWRCRVIAADGSDTSAFSQARAFMPFTGLPSGCAVPVVVSPTDGSSTGANHPELTVANIDTVSTNTYFFEIDEDTTFSNLFAYGVVPQGSEGTTSWRVTTSLTLGETYYWRVRVNNCEFSGKFQLTISPQTSAPAPSTYAYPNPLRLSTGTEVHFANVPFGTSLTIMTISGDVVRELANDGQAEILWDGRNQSGNLVASGTYLWFCADTGIKGKLIVVR